MQQTRTRKTSVVDRDKIVKMFDSGITQKDIAQFFEISQPRVSQIISESR